MTTTFTALLAAVLLITAVPAARAQAADASGHWTGAIKGPSGEIDLDVDLVRAADGAYAGALSMPGEQLKGLPLKQVTVDGRSIRFYARTDQQFTGTVSPDGGSIAGELTVPQGSAPLTLNRSGDAHLDGPITSPRLSAELDGTWAATMGDGDASMHLVLTINNQPDGSAIAYLDNEDEGGLRLPVRVTQRASAVTVDSPIFNGSFAGTLSADATELAGTYTQGRFTAPVTFRRTR